MDWACKDKRCDVSVEYGPRMCRTIIQHGGGEALFSVDDVEVEDSSSEEIQARYNEWVKRVHDYRDGFLPKE